ncbi:amidase [Xanthobacter versatilis]|uniref:amidase n=1 Tax=Xanthobacter autotrophicus (strain ATCC BAA-1158 / Py2) TaxID=78245 RepID=UPI0037269437
MSIFVKTLSLGADGPRVAVKDTIDIAGEPTMAGSRALADAAPATEHAEVVARALAAGCRIVGKTTLHELAFGVTGINDWSGTPENPKWPHLVPGGSSSGSAAAVAAGLADFALGTDTGGSVRIPAACCGVFGLKPTFGRVSRHGVMPTDSTIDCVGPIATSADMLMRAMEIIDPTFARRSVNAPRIGRVAVKANPAIHRAVNEALAASGVESRDVKLAGLEAAFSAGLAIINAENVTGLGHLLQTGLVGDDVARRLAQAAAVTREEIAAAEFVRAAFTAEIDALLEALDVLVLPTMPEFPPTLAEARGDLSAVGMTTFVRPFNLSGHPAATVPLLAENGAPAGLQVVGRKGEDALVLAVAERVSPARSQ